MNYKKLSLNLLIITIIISFGFINEKNSIVGDWQGYSTNGEEVRIEFRPDSTANIYRTEGGRIDGQITGASFWPNYKLDRSSVPLKLDFEYLSKDSSKSHIQLCILEFESANKIRIGFPKTIDKRPESFDNDEVSIIWKLNKKTTD